MRRSERQAFPASILWLLVALTLGWGFNWPLLKLAISEMPILTFRSLCLFGGAAGLFLIGSCAGMPLRVPRGQWRTVLFIALMNISIWNLCVIYGIRHMTSGRAAILAYTMPLWGVLLSAWLLRERLTQRRILGIVLGMGAMLLLLINEIEAVQAAPKGTLLLLFGAFFWALGTVLIRRHPVDMPVVVFTAWQLLLGGIPIYAGMFAFEIGQLRPLTLWPALAVVYNLFVAFIFCQWAWFKIAVTVPVGVSTLSTLMIPVVGVFSGMLVLGEQPHWQDFAALALVLLALGTVMLPPGWFRALVSGR